MHIRAPKDFWSGIMFIAFAATALLAARGYSLGAVGKMGPGYFPVLLGSVLAFIGFILVARSFVISGEALTHIQVLPLVIIAAAVVLFGVLLQPLGLVISLALVTIVSAVASRESKPLEVAALTCVMAAFAVGVFVYGLRLPLPLWPAAMGG
ncbi:MAG: tripartite tricarboxylate transporter TctB family protein [Pseudomonadota bacterium]